MSIEANKAIVRRYKVDILNSRDLAALDAIVGDDYLDHAAFPGQSPGLAGLKQRVAYLFEAFDPQWTIHDIVAERDIVVVRWSHSAVHRGEFLGLEPTGRAFTMRGIDMYRITAGRCPSIGTSSTCSACINSWDCFHRGRSGAMRSAPPWWWNRTDVRGAPDRSQTCACPLRIQADSDRGC